jgi:hypothetical protein
MNRTSFDSDSESEYLDSRKQMEEELLSEEFLTESESESASGLPAPALNSQQAQRVELAHEPDLELDPHQLNFPLAHEENPPGFPSTNRTFPSFPPQEQFNEKEKTRRSKFIS